jgi:uncharacterized protein YndB with AHSA1/START domain
MAPRLHTEAEGTTSASPEAVWALVSDATRYPQWGPWSAAAYQSPGDSAERGPGAVYWLRSADRYFGRAVTTVEKILQADEATHLAYTVVGGLPLRNYRADVTLTPVPGGGTRIRWSAEWDATLPGRLAFRSLSKLFPRVIASLSAAAQKQPAA